MKPKEKAKDILDMFGFIHSYDGLDIMDDELTNKDRKQCALIVVEEMITEIEEIVNPSILGFRHRYWKLVKQEIENL